VAAAAGTDEVVERILTTYDTITVVARARTPARLREAATVGKAAAKDRCSDPQRVLPALAGQRQVQAGSNSRTYEYWESQRKAGREITPNELAAECGGVTIHAACKAIPRYRAGRVPVAKTPGLAPKTVKNVHRMIHLELASAVAWRYLEYNPAEHAALSRESRRTTRATRATAGHLPDRPPPGHI
jgi:hypothetical protein